MSWSQPELLERVDRGFRELSSCRNGKRIVLGEKEFHHHHDELWRLRRPASPPGWRFFTTMAWKARRLERFSISGKTMRRRPNMRTVKPGTVFCYTADCPAPRGEIFERDRRGQFAACISRTE